MTQNPKVKCTVDQCTHWMTGNQCMAAKISVYNDETSSSHTAGDTQCKSFHNRKSMGDMVGALHNANIGGTMMAALSGGDTQITPSVECYVSNCAYWSSGNLCVASAINVAGINAARTQDTDCETFKLK